ncbi:hypothetical protein [Streptococcus salivarius]|uniref:hypothetical protein n=1 Tax=Streptococcus salivarius TaxID=1304 RepID=UPI000AF72819|nr:hypothetical protein [Streptococcus salivarius]
MGMTYKEKLEEAKIRNIIIPSEILKKDIVGVYKFFAILEDKKICFYVGKSTNIRERLLSSNGHIHLFFKDSDKLVPSEIKNYLNEKYKIVVEIIKVNYYDTEFTRASHRLALVELAEIVKYQSQGQCLKQLPEGVSDNEFKYWENNYKL